MFEDRSLRDAAAVAMSHELKHGVQNRANSLAPNGLSYIHSMRKRVFDIAVALVALVLLSPVLLGIAIALRLTQKNVFFFHGRIGKDGDTFKLAKFQTMVENAEAKLQAVLNSDPALRAEWDENQKLINDPRVTRFGNFLRKTSLDELPQLWNVLIGDLSIIGPRPMIQDERKLWGPDIALYDAVKPGISGEWQLKYRTGSDYRTRRDCLRRYLQNASLTTDLKYAFGTAFVFFDSSKTA